MPDEIIRFADREYAMLTEEARRRQVTVAEVVSQLTNEGLKRRLSSSSRHQGSVIEMNRA